MRKKIEILYKHYEDSFSLIRERERQRDRLFLITIGLLGLILLQLMYSIALFDAVDQVSIIGFSLSLKEIPIPALVSLSWTISCIILLRYYQVTVHIEKQYTYLHQIEKELSEHLKQPELISRESSGYHTDRFSLFRHWVWIFYTAIYPCLVIIILAWTLRLEWATYTLPIYHKIFDTTLGLLGISFSVFYLLGQWLNK